jgi:transcriptional regulator with XRE-family HTH domain
MEAERFPGRLRELREAAGLTQRDLADKIGVHVDAVARWEQGRREPSWATVLALAEALGVDCTAFTQAPAQRPPAGPGRPRKGPAEAPAPMRPRGRPRKEQAADLPPAQEKPARRKPPRQRGV